MQEIVLYDIGIIIIAATLLAFVAKLFKQPLIPAYIVAGIILGPIGLSIISDLASIKVLAELGIAFLLFIVGLEFSIRRLRSIGGMAGIVGVLQASTLFTIGFFVALLFGLPKLTGIYVGLIIAFSSTMVVIKLLADKEELDTLHGRLAVGILLTEDLLIIVALSFLLNLGNLTYMTVTTTIIKGIGLLAIAILTSKYFLPHFLKYVVGSQELLFLASISWLFIFMGLATYCGFSIIIGAFIAGVGLASFPYNLEIISRMMSLKDFFITLFFVSLGVQFALIPTNSMLVLALVLSAIVIFVGPTINMLCASLTKYGPRTSFLTGTSLGQISEFALVIIAQGMLLGHITDKLFSITILVAVITLSVSTYFIEFGDTLYNKLAGILPRIRTSIREENELEHVKHKLENHVVLLGGHRMGRSIVKELQKLKYPFVVVDQDPDVIKHLISNGINCVYGDANDIGILKRVKLNKARLIISTLPGEEEDMLVLEELKRTKSNALFFSVVPTITEALEIYAAGADYVMLPRFTAGEKIASILGHTKGKETEIDALKKKHIKELEGIESEQIVERYGPKFMLELKRKKRDKNE